MELFRERGYDETTVAGIAERAGLTERTFFRHFADKREVLFSGQEQLQAAFLDAVEAADLGVEPLAVAVGALEAAGPFFADRLEFARLRQGVIDAHPALQERELIKMASLAAALAAALRGRGAGEPAASLAAEHAISVFRVAFARWLEAPGPSDLVDQVRAAQAEIVAMLRDWSAEAEEASALGGEGRGRR
ncbi:TetR/AcrR family transcriptional regulator [Pseudonocardia ailaonensis]|uniref:TetR/AcrR family transcriptional regulator n=2 Tax=Pseudonocardia ailaonensis TaxID=367279 RepID=A0ABN2MZ47_9PSEU